MNEFSAGTQFSEGWTMTSKPSNACARTTSSDVCSPEIQATPSNCGPSGPRWRLKSWILHVRQSCLPGEFNLLTTLILAGTLLASPQADKWDIKAGMAPKSSATYDLVINVMVNGSPQSATGKFVVDMKDAPQGKPA